MFDDQLRFNYDADFLIHFLNYSLAIRLFALNFYEVIVDEAEDRINYHLVEIESE